MDTQALIELKLKQGLGLRQIKEISSTATATTATTAYTNISGELSWKISAWWCFPKYSPAGGCEADNYNCWAGPGLAVNFNKSNLDLT